MSTRHRLAEAIPPDHYAAASETQRRLLPRVVAATVLILALVAALLSATADAADTPTCFPAPVLREVLAKEYHEEPVVRGLRGDGLMFEIWASEGGLTWTHISIAPDGTGCVLAAGKAIEVRPRSDEGKPV